jgi:hypothetical protein
MIPSVLVSVISPPAARAMKEQKAPFQRIPCRLLGDGGKQQRRHRDVLGEMREPVG